MIKQKIKEIIEKRTNRNYEKELPDSENELWEDGGFIKKINPEDM